MRKANVKRIVCILLFTFSLSGCKYANDEEKNISFTLTFEEDGQLRSEVYYFDIRIHGISERKKQYNDISEMGKYEIQI